MINKMKELCVMYKLRKYKNFIISVLLLAVIWTACGMAVDDYEFFSKSSTEGCIVSQIMEISNHFQNVKQENNSVVIEIIRSINYSSRKSLMRGELNIIALILLVLLFKAFQSFYKLSFRSVCRFRAYIIAYIHNIDGRKRFS